jgi:hypothetical protein
MDMSYSDFMTDNPGGGVFNLRWTLPLKIQFGS